MSAVPFPRNPSILILKADRLYGEALRQAVSAALPRSRVTLVHTLDDAQHACAGRRVDLLISGLGYTGRHDTLDFISRYQQGGEHARVLVVSTHFAHHVLTALHTLGVAGVFDAAIEPPATFIIALREVLAHRPFWSESLKATLRGRTSDWSEPSRVLTITEQIAFSIMGDGCDDMEAAEVLDLSPATTSKLRSQLHRKLGLQHRGELIRVAAQSGFVRFTQAGVVRPGFALLAAAYQARRRRRPAAA